MEVAFETVDVFTGRRFGGNPLAVVPDAAGLSDSDMQAIAREFNLSETAFVLPPSDPAHTARVRIFTTLTELAFAGHPNVGTALVLAAHAAQPPAAMVFEEAAGLVPIRFDWSGPHGMATLDAPQPLRLGAELPAAVVAECAGLDAATVLTTGHPPLVAGMGNDFVVAEVTAAALTRAAPDIAAMRAAAALHPVRPLGFPLCLYARDGEGVRVRMFAPLGGVAEDPATGSAAVAVAGLLLHVSGAERGAWSLRQGAEMGRPSLLHTAAWRDAQGVRASVGGGAVPVMRGVIRL